MRRKYTETMLRLTREIQALAKDLPPGKGHQIANRCSQINVIIKKIKDMNTDDNFTSQQIAHRYNAKKAAFEAMCQGTKDSCLDSRELEVSAFHTTICKIRKDIDSKSLPWELKDQWISFGRHGKRCKEYWLERRVESWWQRSFSSSSGLQFWSSS